MTHEELLKKHPHFNLARVDALLTRLDRLGIEPDKYNLRSRYEEASRMKPLPERIPERTTPSARLKR